MAGSIALTEVPAGIRLERGLWWPADDVHCAAAVWDSLDDLALVTRLCRGNRLAVQAGGNCGVWARKLAKDFERVITFEPHPVNFRCLVHNVAGLDVVAFPAALGEKPGWCDLDGKPNNAGAYEVADGTAYPVMALDALDLPACDLIYLDIEGSEPAAFAGARRTIERFQPVIAFEDKGISRRYGVKQGETEKRLDALGYKVVARPKRDVVMVGAE
jgi:FkbM family methyltransferase